jgi:hypothetical protein
VFDIGTHSFGDVINALNVGFNPYPTNYTGTGSFDGWELPNLRIGIKVQGIGDYSDTYILTPIPPSVIIGLLGVGVAGMKLRKFV